MASNEESTPPPPPPPESEQEPNNNEYYYQEEDEIPPPPPEVDGSANTEYTQQQENYGSYGYNIDDQELQGNSGSSSYQSQSSSSVSSSSPSYGGSEEEDTHNIFVGDLRVDVTEQDLKEAFTPCGEIASVHLFRDPHTHEQKGFGFVHFKTREGQQRALTEEFSHVSIKGRPCRVNLSEQKNTLFLGNLPIDLNQEQIREAVENILATPLPEGSLELKTGPPPAFESRGFCFVQFANHHRAEAARKILLASSIKGRPLNVSWAESKVYRSVVDDEVMSKVKTLFVSNIAVTVNEQVLVALFTEHGTVGNCAIVKHPTTKQSRGFAFIEMDTRENAEKALHALDGRELVGQKMSVVLAKPPPHKLTRERGDRGDRGERARGGGGRGAPFHSREPHRGGFQQRGPPQSFQPYGMNQGFPQQPSRGVYRAHSSPSSSRGDRGSHYGMQPQLYQQHPYQPRGRGGDGGGRGGKFRGGRGGHYQQPGYGGQQQAPYAAQASYGVQPPYQQQAARYSPYQQNRQAYPTQTPPAYPAHAAYQAQQTMNPYLAYGQQTADQTAQYYQYQMDPVQQSQYYQQQQQYYQAQQQQQQQQQYKY